MCQPPDEPNYVNMEQCLYCREERPGEEMILLTDGAFCGWNCRGLWIAENKVCCFACEALVLLADATQIDRTDDWICDECMDDPDKLFKVISRSALVIASHKETNNENIQSDLAP